MGSNYFQLTLSRNLLQVSLKRTWRLVVIVMSRLVFFFFLSALGFIVSSLSCTVLRSVLPGKVTAKFQFFSSYHFVFLGRCSW